MNSDTDTIPEPESESRGLLRIDGHLRNKTINLTPVQKRLAQATFLTHYRQTANITQSCDKAGINRQTYYYWMHHDTRFQELYETANLAAQDVLLNAAWERAVHGVQKPIVSMGRVVYGPDGNMLMETEYSDALLIRLMSWRIPGFRESKDNTTQINIDINGSKDSLLERLASSVRVVESEPAQEKSDTPAE